MLLFILPKNLSLRLVAVNKQNYQLDSSTSTRRSTLGLLIGLSPQNELHQLSNIVDLHLAHDLGAVPLNGPYADVQIGRDDLTRLSISKQPQNIPFSARQNRESMFSRRSPLILRAQPQITLYRRKNIIQKLLIAERFLKKVEGSGFHGPHGHRYIPVPGYEYHRNSALGFNQLFLKLQSATIRHAHMK